mmetsp:Transcript_30175/g.86425  ORF Transcript_30175/g.86425 Transcript_30175/m.86425 type:complete len:480 (-) Transcript_30175:234-1673(-)
MAAVQGAAEVPAPAVEASPPSGAELKMMFRAFRNAKDRWQIDSATMKGFYLHSESGYLYIWNQPTGILYEYEQSTGQCQTVWSSALPQVNAELWTVLPLPPTDPASLQASFAQSETLPNCDVFLILTVAHESGRQVPADVLEVAVDDFCNRNQLQDSARGQLCQLSPAGQGYVIQNFRADTWNSDPSRAFLGFCRNLQRQRPPPWGNSACTLRVEATGAIIGRCCPDLDALCREDPPARLAQAHCKIMSEQDRFFICDMETSEEGTLLDGFAVNDQWLGPLKSGSLLTVGPLRIKIQLSDVAKDTPLDASSSGRRAISKRSLSGDASDDDASLLPSAAGGDAWKRKVFQKTGEEGQEEWKRRQEHYKDRAEERRQRSGGEAGSAAVDGLINRFNQIQDAERKAAEAEEARVEEPTREAHREASMGIDGSFLGMGGLERAGIGFRTAIGEELIPNVLDPKRLSAQDTSRMKTQMRFNQTR